MSVEHQPTAERRESNQAELEQLGNERLKEMAEKSAETSPEQSKESRAEAARDALKSHETQPEPVTTGEQTASKPLVRAVLDRALNYRQTVASMQNQLKPASRQFSKVIHQPVVEKSSEVLEKTVMRPSVTFGATWTALIVGLVFYLVSRHYGYRMSGSEMILALVAGAILGIALEGLFRVVRRRA